MNLPDLGVGISFFLDLEPFLKLNKDLVNVLLIEPQTFWFHRFSKKEPYQIDNRASETIKNLPYQKLIHGVANPVGGSVLPDSLQFPPFVKMIYELNSCWASEHLSFSKVQGPEGIFNTGFLLPPRQTLKGVDVAVQSIKTLSDHMPVPLAVETGVNYLKPRSDEMADGEFIARVVEQANCGIVLDLHNIWTNEINGRQHVNDFLKQIPLDRVWEIHLAGGEEEEGYWLDAHSGPIPDELLKLSHSVIPKLPNLHAIILELYPSYLPQNSFELIREQLKKLHELWNMKKESNEFQISQSSTYHNFQHCSVQLNNAPTPSEWENVLGSLVIGAKINDKLGRDLSSDPAIMIYKKLIFSFRASNIVRSLTLTSRILMIELRDQFKSLLSEYFKDFAPEPFASDEALGFIRYLEEKNLTIPYLREILAFEKAVLLSTVEGRMETLWFDYDLLSVVNSLQDRTIPSPPKKGAFKLEVNSDTITYIECNNNTLNEILPENKD